MSTAEKDAFETDSYVRVTFIYLYVKIGQTEGLVYIQTMWFPTGKLLPSIKPTFSPTEPTSNEKQIT